MSIGTGMFIGTGDNILKPSLLDIDMNLLRLQIKALNEKLSKQAEIIKLLKQSNDLYADPENWNVDADGFSVDSDYEEYQFSDEQYDTGNIGGRLARSIKKQVEQLENEK